MVPVRAGPVFAETEYETVPGPLPLVGEVIEIQFTLELAAHWQSLAAALKLKLPVTADEGTVAVEVVSEKLHVMPAWVIGSGCPAIVRLPVRDWLFGLAAIE